MTGAPTLSVKLDDGSGTFPFDITTYVELEFGLTITRGRGTEFDQVQPGTCNLTLNNTDGRFTIGSAVYPVVYDQRIRVAETVGGTTYNRFTGYVPDWPVNWPDGGDTFATIQVTASDRQTRLNRRNLRSITEQEILLDAPALYYPLSEPSGSAAAGDISGNGGPTLTAAAGLLSNGSAFTFGATGPNSWDGLTGCQFAGGVSLAATAALALPGSAFTIRATVIRTVAPSVGEALVGISTFPTTTFFGIGMDSTGNASILRLGGAFVSSTTKINDGLPHDLALTGSGTTLNLYVDGVLAATTGAAVTIGTGAYDASVGGFPLSIGTVVGSVGVAGPTNGIVLHAAFYTSALSSTRIAAHASAVLNGFAADRADQRIARLAAYANIPTAEQNLEVGQQSSIAAQSASGVNAQAAMQAVADAEGGTVFIAGDGKLTEQNKSHRPLRATGSPAISLTVDQIDPSVGVGGARAYLINTATGARNGGSSQRSVNAASLGQYEEYSTDRSNALLTTDELMLNQLTWLTTMYSSPLPRLSALPLDLMTLPQATVQAVLASEFGDMVRITGWPAQTPASLGDLLVEGWTETLTHNSWDISLNTVPAQLFRCWILGDATYSVLGVTTRPYF